MIKFFVDFFILYKETWFDSVNLKYWTYLLGNAYRRSKIQEIVEFSLFPLPRFTGIVSKLCFTQKLWNFVVS